MLFVVRCALLVVRRVLCVVCCWLFITRCVFCFLILLVSCLWLVGRCWLMPFVLLLVCRALCVVCCYLTFMSCCLMVDLWLALFVGCCLPFVSLCIVRCCSRVVVVCC